MALIASGACAWADKEAVPEELSLVEAARTALLRSPLLKRIDANAELASAMTEEAKGGKLPYVEAGTSFVRSSNPVFAFGSLMEQGRFTADRFAVDKLNNPAPVNNNRTTISAQLPLFDAHQTDVRIARALLGVEEASGRREMARQAILMEVVRAYFGSLVTAERVRVARDAVKTAEADVKKIRDMSDVGMVVRSDLLAVEVQLADLGQAVIEADADAEVASIGLNSLLGIPETARPRLTAKLSERRFELPDDSLVAAEALKNRPELPLNDLAIRSAGESLRGARSQYLPKVDLFGVYGLSAETVGADSTDWMVGIKVSLPLFDPGRSSRISQAAASEAAARAGKRADEDRIAVEAIGAHRRLKASREKLSVAAGAVSQAAEVHRIIQDRYQVGLTTVTEVLRSENALLRAKLGELMARYGVYIGYAEFLLASGNLKNVDLF